MELQQPRKEEKPGGAVCRAVKERDLEAVI